MKNINDILYQENILSMFPKIQHYYSQQLGIGVTQKIQSFSSDAEEPAEIYYTFPYQIINSAKLPYHELSASTQTGDTLDSGELATILAAHFSSLLTYQNLELEKLVNIRKHIEHLKSQHLNYNFIDDHPEATVIVRYMDGLYYSVVSQIKQKLYAEFSHPNYQTNAQSHTLLHPMITRLNELATILPHLSTPDLLDFQACFEVMIADPNIPEDFLEDINPTLQHVSDNIHKKIEKTLHFLVTHVNASIIAEQLPTLKSQVQIKQMLQEKHPLVYPEFEHLLEQSIKTTIRDLLDKYEVETNTSVLDLKKKQKLQIIAKLQGLCDEKIPSTDLYQAIITHGDLLKSQSIGRYILDCICWLLQIMPKERHSVTLFQAVAPAKMPSAEPSSEEKKMKKD